MRILHLNTERGFRGGEQQILYLLERLPGHGMESVLACLPGEPLAERAAALGIPLEPFPHPRELSLRGLWRLLELIDAHGIEVVHAHSARTASMACAAGLLRPVRVVLSRRVDFSVAKNPLRKLKYEWLPDRVIAISEGIRQALIADGIAPEAVTTIPSGIDLARLDEAQPVDLRRELGLPAERLLVGTVGALTRHKGHDVLLEAIAATPGLAEACQFLWAGSGEEEAALRAQAEGQGLAGQVSFLGFREDVPGLLRGLDAFALTSREEGLGTSILDAMACRLPVVATRVGGIPEAVIDGQTGLLAPPEAPQSLGAALLRLARDADLRRRLGGQARAHVEEHFLADGTARRTAELYRGLAAPRGEP